VSTDTTLMTSQINIYKCPHSNFIADERVGHQDQPGCIDWPWLC